MLPSGPVRRRSQESWAPADRSTSGGCRVAGKDVVRRSRTYHPQPALIDVHAAAHHRGAERGIGFRVQALEYAPADIQPVEAICGQRAVGVALGDGRSVRNFWKCEVAMGGSLSLRAVRPPFGCSGTSSSFALGWKRGRNTTLRWCLPLKNLRTVTGLVQRWCWPPKFFEETPIQQPIRYEPIVLGTSQGRSSHGQFGSAGAHNRCRQAARPRRWDAVARPRGARRQRQRTADRGLLPGNRQPAAA